MPAANSSSSPKPGVLIGIAVVAVALVVWLLSGVVGKPPPVEDSAPLEAKLGGPATDNASGNNPEAQLGK